MAEEAAPRTRDLSHKEYLDALQCPNATERRRISDTQEQKESVIDSKYHTHNAKELQAASRIQKAYRGHRERRQLDGLTLDPSSRWVEAIKEWRYQTATSQHRTPSPVELDGRERSPSDLAKLNWRRAAQVAQHASAGDTSPPGLRPLGGEDTETPNTMLLDLRYLLEMVDKKHRYGTNLQIYHEQWQRSNTNQNFFYWLDQGDGKDVTLPFCDRAKLDKERIRYLSKDERRDYLVRVDETGKLRWEKNGELISTDNNEFRDSVHGIVPMDSDEPPFVVATAETTPAESTMLDPAMGATRNLEHRSNSCGVNPLDDKLAHESATKEKTPHKHFHVSPATILNHLLRASVKPGTWIYVADTVGRLYVGIKSSGAFQHASFLSGARISSAGLIGIEHGQLTYLSPLSGHYRPTAKSFRVFIDSLRKQGVDLSGLRISRAYRILRGTEYYTKTKAGVSKLVHPSVKKERARRESSAVEDADELYPEIGDHATDEVDQHWREEHEGGLTKLMNDLHIRRKSSLQKADGL